MRAIETFLTPHSLAQIRGQTVRKIKIFKGIESELFPLEEEVNSWLEETGNELVSVTGNIAPQSEGAVTMGSFSASDVLLIVVYEEKQ